MEKDALREEPIEFVLKDFPGTRYYPKFRLTTWHTTGILDEALAEKVSDDCEQFASPWLAVAFLRSRFNGSAYFHWGDQMERRS